MFAILIFVSWKQSIYTIIQILSIGIRVSSCWLLSIQLFCVMICDRLYSYCFSKGIMIRQDIRLNICLVVDASLYKTNSFCCFIFHLAMGMFVFDTRSDTSFMTLVKWFSVLLYASHMMYYIVIIYVYTCIYESMNITLTKVLYSAMHIILFFLENVFEPWIQTLR